MPYAILRFAKRKTGGVTANYVHNERKKEVYKSNPDIDRERTKDNYHFIEPAQSYRKEVKRLISAAGCRTRSNSTVMVETLVTASPEFMSAMPPEEQREFFAYAFRFMAEKVGEENIISAVVHMDEKTPHMHLSFCPITEDKRLSAKTILGNQAQLSKWQTQFHEHMSARWNVLERGISSMETKRKHIPVYSIACGVQELKAALTKAEVKNPIDMERIKLALQGYNFGNGYISWAKRKYGGYSTANAAEFSDMMASRMGWSRYGDKEYVPHVLRYYAFGRIPTGIGNKAIVQVALSQEGNKGGRPYWSWYGYKGRVSWCACFVSWCADKCGYIDSGQIPKFSSCVSGASWFRSRGRLKDRSYVPSPGDIIFFDWGAGVHHVGIVVDVKNGRVNTIEGNSSDAVRRRSYKIGDRRIHGYGIYTF